jgi:putative ABC transport system substrate-binding protein
VTLRESRFDNLPATSRSHNAPASFSGAAGGNHALADPLLISQSVQLAALAQNARLPLIFSRRENVEAGGLISYGPSLRGQFRDTAMYVDKILKGADPANLPVEQPTRLELVVNLKTAKARDDVALFPHGSGVQ